MAIPDADEVKKSLDEHFETEKKDLTDKIGSEIESARDDPSKWPLKVDATGYTDDVKQAADNYTSTKGYSSRVYGDEIKVEKP